MSHGTHMNELWRVNATSVRDDFSMCMCDKRKALIMSHMRTSR